jgi:hypothetical protein
MRTLTLTPLRTRTVTTVRTAPLPTLNRTPWMLLGAVIGVSASLMVLVGACFGALALVLALRNVTPAPIAPASVPTQPNKPESVETRTETRTVYVPIIVRVEQAPAQKDTNTIGNRGPKEWRQ